MQTTHLSRDYKKVLRVIRSCKCEEHLVAANRLNNSNKALLALQKEFTQYQVDERRVKGKDTARMEIRHDNIAKSIQKNEDRIHLINKTLPNKIGEIVSQVEFAQNKINRK
jgi:hypothetical protein